MESSAPSRVGTDRHLCIAHLIGLAWVGANVWGSLLVHEDHWLTYTLAGIVVLMNPVLFGTFAWEGRRHGSIIITFAWPALVAIAWRVVPAFGAAHRWGWYSFGRFLFRLPTWYSMLYMILCGVAYGICIVLARGRAVNKDRSPA